MSGEISADAGKGSSIGDVDGDHVPDLVVSFTRASINSLLGGLPNNSTVTLIITGTLTNCCCESTARDAQQMNYRILFISDGTAAQSQAAHDATLENMRIRFGDVLTTDEVLSEITNARAPARSASLRA